MAYESTRLLRNCDNFISPVLTTARGTKRLPQDKWGGGDTVKQKREVLFLVDAPLQSSWGCLEKCPWSRGYVGTWDIPLFIWSYLGERATCYSTYNCIWFKLKGIYIICVFQLDLANKVIWKKCFSNTNKNESHCIYEHKWV